MVRFAHTSHKNQRDQMLLKELNEAIFVLKLQAQRRLNDQGLRPEDAQQKRIELAKFLLDLEHRVHLLQGSPTNEDIKLAFTGLADQFVKINPSDVPDRLDELERLRKRLESKQELKERDFRLLDGLQLLLEKESVKGVRSLYRL
jgi:hypothetical protein